MKGTEWEYVPQPKQRRHPFFSQDNDTNPNNKQKKKSVNFLYSKVTIMLCQDVYKYVIPGILYIIKI